MFKFLFIFFAIISTVHSQALMGVVFDTLNNPLENANVTAKPLQEKISLKFAIAISKARYKLNYFIKLHNCFFCSCMLVNQKISFNFKF
jgi:hypothetical protein